MNWELMRKLMGQKAKPKYAVDMWAMYDSSKEMSAAASSWSARVFYVLLKSEESHDLKLEDVDAAAKVVYLSIGGPRFRGEAKEARLEYGWSAGDTTLKQHEKWEIMKMLVDRYKGEVPERRQKVNRAGEVIGARVYI